jgi:NRPS condensation-like uncharacterized protein
MTKSELLSPNEMSVDSFLKYSREKEEDRKILKEHSHKSYFIKGSKISREGSNVIVGTISVEQLKTITKKYNVTITSYLTALLINAIYQENYKYNKSKDPIVICIPINLRNYFPSYSMNNFFASILINIDFSKKEYSFDEILNIVANKLKEELDESILIKKFKFYVRLQHNIILRVIPLIIKDVLLKEIGGLLSGHGATTTVSNLGIVDVSNEVEEYIDKFDIIPYTDLSLPIKVGICSFKDKLSISFSSYINETDIQKRFFTDLTAAGIEVRIASSVSELDERGQIK